ncbi:MAG: hypothetical protein AB7F88_19815 [Pyrinomonadaceae bacterium]
MVLIAKGNPEISKEDGFIRVIVTVFGVSIVGILNKGDEGFVLKHDVVLTPNSVLTEDEAREFGLAMALEKWPESDGWSYRIIVRPTAYTFDFGTDA